MDKIRNKYVRETAQVELFEKRLMVRTNDCGVSDSDIWRGAMVDRLDKGC